MNKAFTILIVAFAESTLPCKIDYLTSQVVCACTVEKSGERSFIDAADKDFWDFYYRVALPAIENRPELASKFTCQAVDGTLVSDIECTLCEATDWIKDRDFENCRYKSYSMDATDIESFHEMDKDPSYHKEGVCSEIFMTIRRYGGTLSTCRGQGYTSSPNYKSNPGAYSTTQYGHPDDHPGFERRYAQCRMKSTDEFQTQLIRLKEDGEKTVKAIEEKTIRDVAAIQDVMNKLEKVFPENIPGKLSENIVRRAGKDA